MLRARPLARPLAPIALALMVGIASPPWGVHLSGAWLLAGLIALWAALALAWWRHRPVRLLPLAFFWLLGVAFYQQAWQPSFPPQHVVQLPQEQDLTLLGHLDRPSKIGPERVQLFLRAEAWHSPEGWRPASGKLLVLAPQLEPPPVGTALVLRGRLRTPGVQKNPGVFDRPRYLAADGIFREVRLRGPSDLVFLASGAVPPLGEALRGGIRQLLKELPPVPRAIYLAMLLGDQGEITPELRQVFSRTGTSHLLVINGLHLGMAAAVTYFLIFWFLRRFPWLLLRINAMKVATLTAAATVVAYAWVAGGSPSTQRAEVMVLAYLLLVFLGRPREVWSALALAALIILSLTPLRLFSISFQLSFVAVAALIYLLPRWLKGAPGEGSAGDQSPGWGARLWFRGKEAMAASAVVTLATAPLVAAYFQVVSLLGIVVNLVAIPLVLGLALPLGEAGVLAQALSLTFLAKGLLALGFFPLWLGYEAIALAARLPGSAMIMPIPTWLQIAAYYLFLILLFAPRRHYLTWAGAGLAGAVLVGTVVLPWPHTTPVLEVTCLDSPGLSALVVTPEGSRLVVSASGHSWPGRRGSGPGSLPAYCHWRQFRRLDQVVALNLTQNNAGELLTLAQQFVTGGFWYGRRGPEGPAYWDLWNFLGDRGRAPRSLERGRPPTTLGSVALDFLPLGGDHEVALKLTHQGRQTLIIPPLRRNEAEKPGLAAASPVEALIIHKGVAGSDGLKNLLTHWQPQLLVIYGGSRQTPAPGAGPPGTPCYFTGDGAVSLYFSSAGATVKQWQGEKGK